MLNFNSISRLIFIVFYLIIPKCESKIFPSIQSTVTNQHHFNLENVGNYRVLSHQYCNVLCLEDARCDAYTYTSTENNCVMKHKASQTPTSQTIINENTFFLQRESIAIPEITTKPSLIPSTTESISTSATESNNDQFIITNNNNNIPITTVIDQGVYQTINESTTKSSTDLLQFVNTTNQNLAMSTEKSEISVELSSASSQFDETLTSAVSSIATKTDQNFEFPTNATLPSTTIGISTSNSEVSNAQLTDSSVTTSESMSETGTSNVESTQPLEETPLTLGTTTLSVNDATLQETTIVSIAKLSTADSTSPVTDELNLATASALSATETISSSIVTPVASTTTPITLTTTPIDSTDTTQFLTTSDSTLLSTDSTQSTSIETTLLAMMSTTNKISLTTTTAMSDEEVNSDTEGGSDEEEDLIKQTQNTNRPISILNNPSTKTTTTTEITTTIKTTTTPLETTITSTEITTALLDTSTTPLKTTTTTEPTVTSTEPTTTSTEATTTSTEATTTSTEATTTSTEATTTSTEATTTSTEATTTSTEAITTSTEATTTSTEPTTTTTELTTTTTEATTTSTEAATTSTEAATTSTEATTTSLETTTSTAVTSTPLTTTLTSTTIQTTTTTPTTQMTTTFPLSSCSSFQIPHAYDTVIAADYYKFSAPSKCTFVFFTSDFNICCSDLTVTYYHCNQLAQSLTPQLDNLQVNAAFFSTNYMVLITANGNWTYYSLSDNGSSITGKQTANKYIALVTPEATKAQFAVTIAASNIIRTTDNIFPCYDPGSTISGSPGQNVKDHSGDAGCKDNSQLNSTIFDDAVWVAASDKDLYAAFTDQTVIHCKIPINKK